MRRIIAALILTLTLTSPVAAALSNLDEFNAGDAWTASDANAFVDWIRFAYDIRDLRAYNNAANPLGKIDVTADVVRLTSPSGESAVYQNVSEELNLSFSGAAGGLDTGSRAANTWYAIWAIGKVASPGDSLLSDVALLGSTSFISPSMPSGWTYKRLVSAVLTDDNIHAIRFHQFDNSYRFAELQNVTSAYSVSAHLARTSLDLSGQVPPVSTEATLYLRLAGYLNNHILYIYVNSTVERAISYVQVNAGGVSENDTVTLYAATACPNQSVDYETYYGGTGFYDYIISVSGFLMPIYTE